MKTFPAQSLRQIGAVIISVLLLIPFSASAAITITTSSKTFSKDGGAASVLTGGDGTWTATTDANWITFNRGSGNAGMSCVYIVSANFSADTRSAVIDIGGNAYTVTQTGYTATLSPASASFDHAGGTGTVFVTADAGVSWSARANVDWLSVTPATGMSAGTVTYTVQEYPDGVTTRTGSLTIAGQTVTVTQTGQDVTISPTSKTLDAPANVFEVTVSALSTTSWTVLPNASWISVVDNGYGFGNSSILISVGQNPSVSSRTGTVSIGSKTLSITQKGMTDPVLSITPTTAVASPTGAYGNIAVYATPDAKWTSESLSDWITISEGDAGAGNGNIKYVAAANPLLMPRTGEIRVTPPILEPDNISWDGLLMNFSDRETTDQCSGRRTISQRPNVTYDGTFHSTLSGDAIPKLEKNEFSVFMRFKVAELNAVNRLAWLFENSTVWVNTDNKLCFDNTVTSYTITSTSDTYWFVLTQATDGVIQIFAGKNTSNGSRIAQFNHSPLRTLTSGTTAVGSVVRLGYGTYPSEGNFKGQLPTFMFWGRQLTETEAKTYIFNGNNETGPIGAPSRPIFTHFPCSGNGNYSISTNQSIYGGTSAGITVSGWSEFSGRTGLRQRAMTSDGEGNLIFSDVNKIFNGTYKLNNGAVFDNSHYGYYSGGSGINRTYYPSPVTSSGPFSATYNLWVYLDQLPTGTSTFKLLERTRVSGQGYDAGRTIVNNWYNNNQKLVLEIFNDGSIMVTQNSSATTFRGGTVVPRRWTMITLVGEDQKSISVFKDGVEIGSVSSSLSFGYFPPTDARECSYHIGSSASSEGWRVSGSIKPTVQSLTIGGWDGAIDEFTIFHGTLTSAQVKALYDARPPAAVYHTVTQGVINPVVSPTTVSFDAAGGSMNVQVTVPAVTQWTSTSDTSWINITSSASGAGSAQVSFDVAPNPATESRTGTMTLAGKTVTVTQSGLWSQLAYDGTVFSETSDSGWIDVQVEGDGTWTASTDADWLTLLDTEGHGSASVMFVVDDFNTTVASRTATVTIAGKQVTVTQRGYELSIDPAVAEIGSNAGAGEIGITAPIDAVWEAIVSADWISLVGGATGVGSGTLRYTVADNTTGQTRRGKIIISGQEYTVTQHPYLTLTTVADGEGSVAGGGNFETNDRATLTATPAAGHVFSHWSGDAVGISNVVSFTMDAPKTVTAHFIPEGVAQRLAEEKAAQGGFYTRDQMRRLALGDTVIELDGDDGNIGLSIQLQERPDLGSGSWTDVDMTGNAVSVDARGRVHIRVPPKGNSAFYRLVNKGEE